MSDVPGVTPEGGEDAAELETEEGAEPEEGDEILDAPEGEEPEEADPEQPLPEPAKPSRAATRIQRLQQERDEARREAAEARGFRQALEQRPQQPAVDAAAQQRAYMAQMQERWNQMAPADAMAEMWQLGQQQIQNAMVNQHIAFNDRLDKQAYETATRTSALHKRHQAEVERQFVLARSRGNYDETRESLLYKLAGQEAVERANRAAPAQRRQATTRVAGQQARPTGARGDGAAGNRRPAAGTPEDDDRLIEEYFQGGGRL